MHKTVVRPQMRVEVKLAPITVKQFIKLEEN